MKRIIICLVATVFSVTTVSFAASKLITVKGALPSDATGIILYTQKGHSIPGTVNGRKFSISASKSDIKGGSLILINSSHQLSGAVALAQKPASKSFTKFGSISTKTVSLGNIVRTKGYARLKKFVSDKVYDPKSFSFTAKLSAPLGLNNVGANSQKQKVASDSARAQGGTPSLGSDSDRDGTPDGLDIDSNGNGTVDVLSGYSGVTPEMPYLIVEEDFQNSLNVTATGVPTDSQIDAVLTSTASLMMGFAFEVQENASAVTGAHVVCDDSSLLCGKTTGLATTNNQFNGLWRDYHPDNSEYPGLELSDTRPGSKFFNTGIAAHVGPSAIRPGDTFRIEFTNSSGDVVLSKQAVVAPYLATVPALHNYVTNSISHDVDYSQIGTELGSSSDHPLLVGSDGLITMSFWRPQRKRIGGSDGDGYVDAGGLRYGVEVRHGQGDPSCNGYYSNLSGTLTEEPATPAYNPWPLTDSATDSDPSPTNLISFTVDLKNCLQTNGVSTGTPVQISLQAAGANLGHGANRSGQNIWVMTQ